MRPCDFVDVFLKWFAILVVIVVVVGDILNISDVVGINFVDDIRITYHDTKETLFWALLASLVSVSLFTLLFRFSLTMS